MIRLELNIPRGTLRYVLEGTRWDREETDMGTIRAQFSSCGSLTFMASTLEQDRIEVIDNDISSSAV